MYLSVYTLYRQEDEEFLEGWIQNALAIGDECIIIDGSNTLSFNSKKIRVYTHPQSHPRYSGEWQQSEQRNLALAQAKGRWILQLDIDERVNNKAREVLAKNDYQYSNINVYAVATLNFWESEGKVRVDSGFFPDWHYRFIRNNRGIQYSTGSRHLSLNVKPDVRCETGIPHNKPYFLCDFACCIGHLKYMKPRLFGDIYRLNRKEVKTLEQYYKDVVTLPIDAVKVIFKA